MARVGILSVQIVSSVTYPSFANQDSGLVRRILDGASLAAVAIVVLSSYLFVTGADGGSGESEGLLLGISGGTALFVGAVASLLGGLAVLISRRVGYTNGARLGVSLLVIVFPLVGYGLSSVLGLWPDPRYRRVVVEGYPEEAEYAVTLAEYLLAVATTAVGVAVGVRYRAGLALGAAFAAFAWSLTTLQYLIEGYASGKGSVYTVLLLVAFAVAVISAALAERTERSMATWLHPFVVLTGLALLAHWGFLDRYFGEGQSDWRGLAVGVLALVSLVSGVLAVLLQRIPYALASLAAILWAENLLFEDLFPNNRVAWAVSLLTGLVVVAALAFAVIRRSSSRRSPAD